MDALISLLILILVLSPFPLVIGITVYIQKQRKKKFQEIAVLLNLQFQEKKTADLPAIPGLSLLMNFVDTFEWELLGKYNDHEVNLHLITRGSGKSSKVYTIVEVFFEEAFDYEMQIYKEQFYHFIGKKLFGVQDIQVGDEKLDKELLIKGKNEHAIKDLITDRNIKEKILELFALYPEITIEDSRIIYDAMGVKSNPNMIKDLLEKMTELAGLMANEDQFGMDNF